MIEKDLVPLDEIQISIANSSINLDINLSLIKHNCTTSIYFKVQKTNQYKTQSIGTKCCELTKIYYTQL